MGRARPLRALLCAAVLALTGATASAQSAPDFTLVISRRNGFPDSPSKMQITVNDTWPGPTLKVSPGQTISVLVINAIPGTEDTAVHWHGMFQKNTPFSDGVIGVTQCPIPPGGNMTYTFTVPPRSGTYWYHGASLLQRCACIAPPAGAAGAEPPSPALTQAT